MSGTVKTLLIVAAAAVLLFLFRVSVCTIYTIPDNTLAPAVKQGDRVLVIAGAMDCVWVATTG